MMGSVKSRLPTYKLEEVGKYNSNTGTVLDDSYFF